MIALETMGDRIRYARAVRGFRSASAVSRAAKLAGPLVGRIEAAGDAANPTAHTIHAIAAALDVEPAWLFDGTGDLPLPKGGVRRRRPETEDAA